VAFLLQVLKRLCLMRLLSDGFKPRHLALGLRRKWRKLTFGELGKLDVNLVDTKGPWMCSVFHCQHLTK